MERNELKNALAKMLPAIAKPGDAGNRDCILFRGDTVAAFNDGFGVQILLNSGVTCAVMADPLMKLLRSSKTKEITLSIEENQLKVTSGKSDAHLPLVAASTYERYERILPEPNQWRKLPPDFTERLGMAFMPSDYKLSGVYMYQDILLSSTPNWIMHVIVEASLDRCWITNKAVQALLKFGHVHEIAKVHSWVHFRNEQGTFSCRHLVADSYPADAIFASERQWIAEGEVICKGVIEAETVAVLKEARVFAEADGAEEGEAILKVVFHFDSDGMEIQTESSLGNFKARADMTMQMEEPVTVTTDLARLLMAMERAATSFQLVRHRNEHFMVFRGDNWQMLLAATVPKRKRA